MVIRQPSNLRPFYKIAKSPQSLLFCLIQTNKLIETRRRVCYAAVEVVVGAAREAGEEVFQETMDIVENIEKHAEVVEESLEELLFRPIESIRKVSRAVDPEDLSSVADDEDEDLT